MPITLVRLDPIDVAAWERAASGQIFEELLEHILTDDAEGSERYSTEGHSEESPKSMIPGRDIRRPPVVAPAEPAGRAMPKHEDRSVR
jgi:hypothetical protein